MKIAPWKLIALMCLTVAFSSCQKEVNFQTDTGNNGTGTGGTGNTSDIIGVYDFVGMSAHAQSTVTANQMGQELKAITVANYVTENNTGTATFTTSEFITSGLGFGIDTVMNVQTFANNILLNDAIVPFVTTVPATSDTSSYSRISADSITVTGAFGAAPVPSGMIPTGPIGVKLAWSGDTLLLKVNTTFTQSIMQNGVPATLVGTVNGVTKLKKH